MNTSINLYSDPKLLTTPAQLALIGLTGNVLAKPRHGLESLPLCTMENIQARAETMTPTLQEILKNWPTGHWGINE